MIYYSVYLVGFVIDYFTQDAALPHGRFAPALEVIEVYKGIVQDVPFLQEYFLEVCLE